MNTTKVVENSRVSPGARGLRRAFTLLELLVVIGIIGLLASVTVPAIRGMSQGKTLASGHQQLADDLNRARQEALRLRTTVYFVFAPTNLWRATDRLGRPMTTMLEAGLSEMIDEQRIAPERLRQQARRLVSNIALGAFQAYAMLVEREPGAQPGRSHTRYLGPGWQHLPDGVVFPQRLFGRTPGVFVLPNDRLNHVIHELPMREFRFPVAEFPGDTLPPIPLRFIAFGPDGRLAVSEMNRGWEDIGRPELRLPPLSEITLGVAEGSVFVTRDGAGRIDTSIAPDLVETPRDNATNNRVVVSSLTGRSRILKTVLR